jgi:6-pyruvoyl tetrahydropterin synthase/QueD family protein
MPAIEVSHSVEMGHRLALQPDSKCYHLHGHSWKVFLTIYGPMDPVSGMILDFTDVKHKFRTFLDTHYDHHFLLNPQDPLVALMCLGPEALNTMEEDWGITYTDGCDPTVENFARIILDWARNTFPREYRYHVKVFEASTNAVEYGDFMPRYK